MNIEIKNIKNIGVVETSTAAWIRFTDKNGSELLVNMTPEMLTYLADEITNQKNIVKLLAQLAD